MRTFLLPPLFVTNKSFKIGFQWSFTVFAGIWCVGFLFPIILPTYRAKYRHIFTDCALNVPRGAMEEVARRSKGYVTYSLRYKFLQGAPDTLATRESSSPTKSRTRRSFSTILAITSVLQGVVVAALYSSVSNAVKLFKLCKAR